MTKRLVVLTAICLGLFVGAAGAGHARASDSQATQAAPAPAGAAVPTAEAILARYVEVTGGAAAHDAIRNRVVHARLEIAGAGIVINVTVYAARPDSIYTLIESEPTGRIESGVSDGVVWENSQLRGAIVKDGAERDDALRDAVFERMVHWKDTSTSAECTGVVDVAGKPAYRLVLTPKTGSAQTFYFDKDSSLLVRTETMTNSAAGQINVVAEPGDYRAVDGILMPFVSRVAALGQQRTLTIEKIEHNVDLPADRFALPAEVKAIAKK